MDHKYYKHVNTQTVYRLLCYALASDKSLGPQVVYQRCIVNPVTKRYIPSPEGSNCWTRPLDEFFDGRFEAVNEYGETPALGASDAAMAS